MECHIQIFLNGCWQTAALFEPDITTLDQGVAGGCRLQYDIDYAEMYGEYLAGASSVQGEAPKYLLVEDYLKQRNTAIKRPNRPCAAF